MGLRPRVRFARAWSSAIKKVEFMENVRALAFVNFTSFTEDNEDYNELGLNQ